MSSGAPSSEWASANTKPASASTPSSPAATASPPSKKPSRRLTGFHEYFPSPLVGEGSRDLARSSSSHTVTTLLYFLTPARLFARFPLHSPPKYGRLVHPA